MAGARAAARPGRSAAIVNADIQTTAQFVRDTSTRYAPDAMLDSLRAVCREVEALPAASAVAEEFGDAIYLNITLLGLAYQRGLVPVTAAAIERAITLNGAQIERNLAAFALGRRMAVEGLAPRPAGPETLDALVARRVADLTAYQSARYARRYADFVAKVRAAEARAMPGEERLARAVATQLYRLMAFKDEYEVARLHSLPEWKAKLAADFTGNPRVEMNLAPPMLSKTTPPPACRASAASGPGCCRRWACCSMAGCCASPRSTPSATPRNGGWSAR
jgi:indolepyruvate ferredoxin oxidoreductase